MKHQVLHCVGAFCQALVWAGAASAADLGGACCSDLEQRIAELESTVARQGNRKMSLTLNGQVNKAILLWDDGGERNAYDTGNKNDQSSVAFKGDASLAKGWSAGYDVTIRLRDALTDDVDQSNHHGTGGPFQIWQAHWWVAGDAFGKVSLGRASRVTDTASENDLSHAGVAGYVGVEDIGNAFALRAKSGALAGLAWGDVYNHFNGDTANVIRYDTPALAGFVASASWGEDDIWDVGVRFDAEVHGFTFASSLAYTEVRDASGSFAEINQNTLLGSAAIRHEASGLNALVAFGVRRFDEAIADTDGILRQPEDARFVYAKLGLITQLNSLGSTAFYGEYGWFKDFVSVQSDGVLLAALDNGGFATRIGGDTAQVWGAGIVQHIDSADMHIYLGYRLHHVDFELLSGTGANVPGVALDDFHTVIAGTKISF